MAQMLEEERALVPVRYQSLEISQKDLDMYKKHFCEGVSDQEWEIFIQKCCLYGLNPMLNEIFLVGRNTKKKIQENGRWIEKYEMHYSTQVALTGLINLARRTGEYEGYSMPEYFDCDMNKYEIWSTKLGPYPYAIRIGAFRRGNRQATLIPTYFHERAQYVDKEKTRLTFQWQQQGIHMHLKCAIAAAVRWEFTEVCGGIYIHEEMPIPTGETRIYPHPSVVEAVQPGSLPPALTLPVEVQPTKPQRPSREALIKSADQYVPGGWPTIEKVLASLPDQQPNLVADYDNHGAIPEEYFDEQLIDQARDLVKKLAKESRQKQQTPPAEVPGQEEPIEAETKTSQRLSTVRSRQDLLDQRRKQLAHLKATAKKRVPGDWAEVIEMLISTSPNLKSIKQKHGFLRDELLVHHLDELEKIIDRLIQKAQDLAEMRRQAPSITTVDDLFQFCADRFGEDAGLQCYQEARAAAITDLSLGDVPDSELSAEAIAYMFAFLQKLIKERIKEAVKTTAPAML